LVLLALFYWHEALNYLNVFSIGDFLFLLSLRNYLNDEEYACGGSYYDNYHHWGNKKFENNRNEAEELPDQR